MAGPIWRVGLMVWLAISLGCSRTPGPSDPTPSERVTGAGSNPDSNSVAAVEGLNPGAAGPAEAVRGVLQGLEKRRLRAVWDFLPGSYQADLQRIVRQVGERMDPELWTRAWALVPRLTKLIRERGDWMVQPAGNAVTPPTAPQALTVGDLKTLADCLDRLAQSDVADVKRLRELDLGAWCDRVGESVLGQVELFARRVPGDSLAQTLAVLGDVEVRSAARSGETATVELSTPGSDAVPVEYVHVEGKWIPRDLAESWIEGMGQAQARLAVVLSPETLAANRGQWESMLGATEEWLDRLERAASKERFDFAWSQGVQNVLTVAAGLVAGEAGPEVDSDVDPRDVDSGDETPGAGGVGSERAAPVPLVKVIVRGEYGVAEQDRLLMQVAGKADGGRASVQELAATGAELTLTIGPVADCEEFAQQLEGWTISKVDRAARTIWAVPATNR